jgi:tryptophan-rich sensory protein
MIFLYYIVGTLTFSKPNNNTTDVRSRISAPFSRLLACKLLTPRNSMLLSSVASLSIVAQTRAAGQSSQLRHARRGLLDLPNLQIVSHQPPTMTAANGAAFAKLRRVEAGGAAPARMSNGACLVRRFVAASVEASILFAVVRGANEIPLSMSKLLSMVGIAPDPTIMGVPAVQWLAWFAVLMPPNLVKYLCWKSDVDKRPPGWYTGLRPGWGPPAWSLPLLKFGVSKPAQLLAMTAIWSQGAASDPPSPDVPTSSKPWGAVALIMAHSSLADAWRTVFFSDRRLGLAAFFAFSSQLCLLATVPAIVAIDMRAAMLILPTILISCWLAAMNLAVCMPRRIPPRAPSETTAPLPSQVSSLENDGAGEAQAAPDASPVSEAGPMPPSEPDEVPSEIDSVGATVEARADDATPEVEGADEGSDGNTDAVET